MSFYKSYYQVSNTVPEITGSSSSPFINSPYHFKQFSKYYFGRNYNIILNKNNKYQKLSYDDYSFISNVVLNNIDSFTYGDYVSRSDEYIMVKFPDR